jgi:hypothetical protein
MTQNSIIHFWRPDPFGGKEKWEEKGELIKEHNDYIELKWISENKWANNKILKVNKMLIIKITLI